MSGLATPDDLDVVLVHRDPGDPDGPPRRTSLSNGPAPTIMALGLAGVYCSQYHLEGGAG